MGPSLHQDRYVPALPGTRLLKNAHEWAKQQARRQGLAFESLDNGFRWCAHPVRLQRICDRLGPNDVQRFFDRWLQRLPWPLTRADRAAGYRHRLTIWQLEVSLTQVFDAPQHGRQFFETLIGDNLDLGRPDRVNLLFPTRLTRRTPPPRGGYHTRVITTGVAPSLHIAYKHTDVKQYFKLGCALRTETTINDAKDFQPTKALETLGNLRTIGKQINHRLLDAERLNHACSLQPSRFERLQQPIVLGNRRVSALPADRPRRSARLGATLRRPACARATAGHQPLQPCARGISESRPTPIGSGVARTRTGRVLTRGDDV